ncbi:uncharacterized protein DUF397 [Micromonospora sp. Llam0]|uniref:DUF397 domain-containing protein n=1 Tax=Micromonospora sp. Llam0 TaxID=2485143 RepID=UPI000F499389|nr:DUF397 domain-containing protein [Micromonospora sp. Llam0]ROO60920.1 uncharacterized protein DUF397 [Micromonospora sp. Llam0]
MKPDTPWFTSSRSGGNGGACVEARRYAGRAEVRDSKDRTGPTLTFSTAQWGTFTTALQTCALPH